MWPRAIASAVRAQILGVAAGFCVGCSPSTDRDAGREAPAQDATAASVDASGSRSGTRSVWSGVYSSDQAVRGRGAYLEACSECHLPDLSGNGVAPTLVGRPFFEKHTGSTVGELYGVVRSTMPQDQPFSLTPQEYVDILAFLLSMNDLPPGGAELDPSQSSLDRIAFEVEAALR